jgi:protein tyrosine phosphatase (PTP) superfamily phosphohydrolase (DUF442 family)
MAHKVFGRATQALAVGALLVALAPGGSLRSHAADEAVKPKTNSVATPLEIVGIHNAFRATDKIYSGSQPEGDAAFAALAKLGVKTIVSVDGSKPDVGAARKHGLRYVHLPIGYDGMPSNRVVELVKVSTTLDGPFFVHCHHGLHRGPAAVAVMCEASQGWSAAKAGEWLRQAGTSPDYPGLYRAAAQFKPPTPEELAAIKTLPEITQPSNLVDAMVTMDEHHSHLRLVQKAGWKVPPGHADISPGHEVTMLWEQLKEMARLPDTAERSDDYRAKLADCEQSVDALRKLLRDPQDIALLETHFKKVTATCAACHKTYRND